MSPYYRHEPRGRPPSRRDSRCWCELGDSARRNRVPSPVRAPWAASSYPRQRGRPGNQLPQIHPHHILTNQSEPIKKDGWGVPAHRSGPCGRDTNRCPPGQLHPWDMQIVDRDDTGPRRRSPSFKDCWAHSGCWTRAGRGFASLPVRISFASVAWATGVLLPGKARRAYGTHLSMLNTHPSWQRNRKSGKRPAGAQQPAERRIPR